MRNSSLGFSNSADICSSSFANVFLTFRSALDV